MKKYLKTVVCTLICLLMTITGVRAAETMELEWRGDYSDSANPKLVVTFSSPAQYQQQVIAVIYPASDTTPTFEEYLRMSEITVNGSEQKTIVFDITDEFNQSNFDYTIELQGSGYKHDVSFAEETVYLINPERIMGGTGLISEIKNSTETTFPGVLEKVMAPLQLEPESDPDIKARKTAIVYGLKDTFSTLEDVRNAWHIADVLVYIGESTSTAEGVAQRLISNADILGIDVTDEDFKMYVDEDPLADDEGDEIADSNLLCEQILIHAENYNNGAGVQSVSELQDLIGEVLGLIVINNSTEDTISDAFNTYKDYFDISSDTEIAYSRLGANQSKALKAIYNKNFASPALLVSAFTTAVNKILDGGSAGDTTVNTQPSDNSDNSDGTTISAPSVPIVPNVPSGVTGFKDVSASHWAHSYVTELVNKGIISGYDDNTFRPSSNVTREEFIKMIVGAAGLYSNDAECDFADVPNNAWYYRYVASAFVNEIVNGVTDTMFGIGQNITRQDVAVIGARILARFEKETTENNVTLTDFDTVSDYAQDSVKLLNSMGIINGFDDGSFKPHNALTRAEAATIICKLINSL